MWGVDFWLDYCGGCARVPRYSVDVGGVDGGLFGDVGYVGGCFCYVVGEFVLFWSVDYLHFGLGGFRRCMGVGKSYCC